MKLYNRFLIEEEVIKCIEELQVTCNMMDIDLSTETKIYTISLERRMIFYFEDENEDPIRYCFALRLSFSDDINEECKFVSTEVSEWDSLDWINCWRSKTLEEGMEKIRAIIANPLEYRGGKYRFKNS